MSGLRSIEEKARRAEAQRNRYRRNGEPGKHLSRYRMTLDDFNAILKRQSGACPLCQRAFGHDLKPVVDHCHSTGAVRGILCSNCNVLLGMAADDPQRLQRGVDYLKDKSTHVYHTRRFEAKKSEASPIKPEGAKSLKAKEKARIWERIRAINGSGGQGRNRNVGGDVESASY